MSGDRVVAMGAEIGGQGLRSGINDQIGVIGADHRGRAFTLDETPGEHPGRTITKLSEEHGWIAHNGKPLPLGTRLVIYPNHSCPVVNLTDRISVTENGTEIAQWPIDARGCS